MNQMKTTASYTSHKASRRATQARKFAQGQANLGAGSGIDGRQALIDLMAETGTRMSVALYRSLVADGYEVPDAIRPKAPDEEKDEAGDAPASPAPESPEMETNPDNYTTSPTGMQTITLTVHYAGIPPTPTTTLATGQLVSYDDGDGCQPPAHSVAEIRLWLTEQGYRPDYTRWRQPAGEARTEVYTREAEAEADTPAPMTPAAMNDLARKHGFAAPVITDEMKAAWRAQAAAEREAPWDPARPDVHYRQMSPSRAFHLDTGQAYR
jgi:hypothetical protein